MNVGALRNRIRRRGRRQANGYEPNIAADPAEHIDFDPVFYLREYTDIANAGIDPLAHYMEYGAAEGRYPRMPGTTMSHLKEFEPPHECDDWRPLVSVIVPSFNHASFLEERLRSIYGQTYEGQLEVILLDDGSSDGSAGILRACAEEHADNTIFIANDSNSGSAFRQWRKGFALAHGELVWIAETDDTCELDFLETLVPLTANPAVMVAFCDMVFFEGETSNAILTLRQYLSDLETIDLSKPWIRSAADVIRSGLSWKNIVPNASGALFRHPGRLPLFEDEQWLRMRLAGDWIFYLELAKGGLIAFSPETMDYHRSGAHTLTTQVGATPDLEKEVGVVRAMASRIYGTAAEAAGAFQAKAGAVAIDVDASRPPILIFSYGLTAGGGEIFPIHLANALRTRGWTVSFVDLGEVDADPGVRGMLGTNVPLFRLTSPRHIASLCDELAAAIVHTCNVSCDRAVARALKAKTHGVRPRHVVTLHGGYETMADQNLRQAVTDLEAVDYIAYTAQKNLTNFSERFLTEHPVKYIPNALPAQNVEARRKDDLGIPQDACVAMVISRAIPEKGWSLARDAVETVRQRSGTDLHLVLIGEGIVHNEMKAAGTPDWVHLAGFQSDIRGWISVADVGMLPTTFAGESFPLVLIDFLTMGVPVIASGIGEIPEMMTTTSGCAGYVVDVSTKEEQAKQLTSALADFVGASAAERRALRQSALEASRKFDYETMVGAYEQIYRSIAAV